MIDIGSIAYGPELSRRPIMGDIERLSQALRSTPSESDQVVEVAFVVPGSLGGADFDGFQIKKRRGPTKGMIVFVSIPDNLARNEAPLQRLISLTRRAIEHALVGSNAPLANGAAPHLRDLQRAADTLGVPWDETGSHVEPSSVRDTPRTDAELGVELVLPIAGAADLDAAFEFEELLGRHIERLGVGYLDGNEVNGKTFTIHAYGLDLDELRSAVQTAVARSWSGGPTRLDALGTD